MRIYVSHSTSFNYKEDLYTPILEFQKTFKKYSFTLPHADSDQPFLTKEALKNQEFDLILAEISYPSTGQGIELSWADLLKVPIIGIHQIHQKPSTSIHTVINKIYTYNKISSETLKRIL